MYRPQRALLLGLVFVSAWGCPTVISAAEGQQIVVTVAEGHIRVGNEIVGRVARGQRLWAFKTQGAWFWVKVPDGERKGWIHNSHARRVRLSQRQRQRLSNATTLDRRGLQLFRNGKFRDAIPLAKEERRIRKEVLGETHPFYANSVDSLGLLYRSLGDYANAEPLIVHAQDIRKKALGEMHPDYAVSLDNLAQLYKAMGDFAKAEPLYLQARDIRRNVLGETHLHYALSLNNLAVLYYSMGDYAKAEALYLRAHAIKKKVVGEVHRDYALSLNNLAVLYETIGNYAKAEALYLQALDVYKKALGEVHPSYARSLNNLAALYYFMGNYARAEPLHLQARDIRKKVLGETHPDYAQSLNNLAQLYRQIGDFAKAEPLYLQARDIRQKSLGEAHPEYALSLMTLAALYRSMGDYAKAEPLFVRARGIYEKALGKAHPEYASMLRHLAELYQSMGQHAKAEPLFVQASDTYEKALGEAHPDYAKSLNNMAVLNAIMERWQDAASVQDKGRRVARRHIDRVLPGFSDREQLTFLNVMDKRGFHIGLSMALARGKNGEIGTLSAGWLINGKAVAQDAVSERIRLSRDSHDPKLAETVQELRSVRARLANLTLNPPASDKLQQYRTELAKRMLREQELSKKLGRARGQAVRDDPWVEVDEIRRSLADGSVLVDIVRFEVLNFQATGPKEEWKEAHYVAWIVPAANEGEIRIVDLGQAVEIEDAVRRVGAALEGAPKNIRRQGEPLAEKELNEALKQLSSLVFDPLLAKIGTAQRLILSPDAALWLVPWAALPLKDGRYAIEKYHIQYVVSGRDLVQKGERPKAATTTPLVMADPDYDLAHEQVEAQTRLLVRGTQLGLRNVGLGPTGSRSRLSNVPRLPGTAAEAQAIAPSITSYTQAEPRLYTDKQAVEGVFKAARSPRIVVLSTHGFFLKDQEVKPYARLDAGFRSQRGSRAVFTTDGKPLENPLLRCGLMLAGCNQRDKAAESGVDDGVLTGLEIVGTDLRGTELVVLSACETGIGEVRNGEGVAGLRQAFQLAGAQAVVATLWQIPDRETARLMNDFFGNLAKGKGKADALRQAQLSRIKARRDRNGAAHPFFWAAFTLTGSDGGNSVRR